MLSKDEITARSLRLSGRAPNPYTGTLNDPFQEAQSQYAGPGWAQFFGGLQKEQEDANLEGKNFRVGWAGFGNAREDGGGSMPRGRGLSLGAMTAADLNPLEEQAQKEFLLQRQANDAIEQAKAEKAAQKAYTDSESARVTAGLGKSYDDFVLSSAFVPASPITRTPINSPTPIDPSQHATTAYTAEPTGPVDPNQTMLRTVPGEKKLALMARLPAMEQMAARTDLAGAQAEAARAKANAPPAVPVAGVDVSPEGVDLAANAYLTTGQMPPLGMGDKTTRQKILNRAGEIQASKGAGSVAENKAVYGADAGSLKKLQNQRDTIGAFEQTAMKNIDLFLETAGKVVDTGSPMANVLARQASGKMLGSPDQAKYDAARQVAINEIAKITSNPTLSGQLSDSARHEVEAFNPAGATLKQSVAVMRLLKQDMGNRTSALDDQLALIRGRLKGGGSGGGAAAPAAPAGFVDMVAPDGRPLHVPAGEVDALLKHGAKRKGGG